MSAWSLLSVVALLGVFAGLSFWLRRLGTPPTTPSDGLVLHARRSLDQQNAVWVIEVDGRRLLVGTGSDGVRLLLDLSPPSP